MEQRRLTPSERRRVIARANIAERTLRRWEQGLPIRDASRERITAAVFAELARTAA